ncbi:MAG: sodium-dependent transporter [Acidobacteriota bacterium]|nr:sodium-dependent transporter [Acidobacteriota bacterium]
MGGGMAEDRQQPEQWGTRLGVILAVSGSAVGLGNFLRFPGQAAQNGGGAFMIPYFCALLLLGIPIGWAEWTMGRYGGQKGFHSGPAILGVFGGRSPGRYFGAISVLIPLAVSYYYIYVESWCLAYFWKYLTGGLGIDPTAPVAAQVETSSRFFHEFVGSAANGVLEAGHGTTIFFFALTVAVNLFLVYRGLNKGIEKFVTWAMPLMAVCALVVLVRVLTLGTPDPAMPERNVLAGLGYMWNPDFAALTNFQTWLAAAGQIFFSLSVGFGVILNYASYMKKKEDVILSGLTASATNEIFEVGFGGMITLTASFVFLGLSGTVAAVQTGSFGLGFNTLPVVFAQMGPIGNFIGATWFLMLFLAAITSSLSMYQPTIAFLRESLGISRKLATTGMAALAVTGGWLVMYFSRNLIFFDTLDFWVGTFLIFILAALQIFLFSWAFGTRRALAEAHSGSHIRIPSLLGFVMKWVTPAYLIVVFIGFSVQNLRDSLAHALENREAQIALVWVLLNLVFLLVLVWRGERRWRAAGLDLDGLREETD